MMFTYMTYVHTYVDSGSGSGKPSECAVPISEDQKPSLYKEFTAILSDIVGVDITEDRKWSLML